MNCISSLQWIDAHHDKGGSSPVKLVTSSIALLTLAFPARAAWANADVKGAEDITGTAGRSITATKIDTPLVETPQAISVIDVTVFRDRGARNLQETMRDSAGVIGEAYGLDTCNDASIIRGLSPVQFLDGMRNFYSYAPFARTAVDTLNLVEVLRGPSSLPYVQATNGGVIHSVSN